MLTLSKTLKVTNLNRKPTGKWKGLKVGDILRVEFDVYGTGGSSPKVDIFINTVYSHDCFAREFHEMFYKGKNTWKNGEYVSLPILADLEEVTS